MDPEARDDLVQDQRGADLLGDRAQLLDVLATVELWLATLYRLAQHGSQIASELANRIDALLLPPRQDQHVRGRLAVDAGRRRQGLVVSARPHDDLVEDAVVIAFEHDDLGPAGHRAGQAHGPVYGLGAGVGKRTSLVPGQLTEQLRDLSGDGRLRTRLDSDVDLLLDGLGDEVRRVPEEDGAEPIGGIDQLVAIDVPKLGALRALHHDGEDDLFPLRVEA